MRRILRQKRDHVPCPAQVRRQGGTENPQLRRPSRCSGASGPVPSGPYPVLPAADPPAAHPASRHPFRRQLRRSGRSIPKLHHGCGRRHHRPGPDAWIHHHRRSRRHPLRPVPGPLRDCLLLAGPGLGEPSRRSGRDHRRRALALPVAPRWRQSPKSRWGRAGKLQPAIDFSCRFRRFPVIRGLQLLDAGTHLGVGRRARLGC